MADSEQQDRKVEEQEETQQTPSRSFTSLKDKSQRRKQQFSKRDFVWLRHPDSRKDPESWVQVTDSRKVLGVDGVTKVMEYKLSYKGEGLRHGNDEQWFGEECVHLDRKAPV